MLGRWQHRVTALVGGPGLGKTTLLAQAVAENRLAPRGEDVWLGLASGDDDATSLGLGVVTALARRGLCGAAHQAEAEQAWKVGRGEQATGLFARSPLPLLGTADPPRPSVVADAIWGRSPVEVCLVLDDAHRLRPGSSGAAWLAELIDVLPANGHVVLSTRSSELPIALVRLVTLGQVLRLVEDDLRFDDDEMATFAAGRGLDASRFAHTGGWPAIAELTASVKPHLAWSFLLEEVLEPLGPDRRRVLAALVDLGGADDELAATALGVPVELRTALDGVPLVAYGPDGWCRPHALWREAPGLGLDPADLSEIRRRALTHLVEREHFDEAFTLLHETERWDLAPAALRAACLVSHRRYVARLDHWLAGCPDTVRASPPGRLAAALHTALTAPAGAVEPLREAIALCRAAGDVDAEMAAISQLGRLSWFRQDPSVFGAEMWAREAELADAGHPHARAMHAFGRAVVADLIGDDATVLEELAGIEPGLLDPGWEAMATWLHVVVRLGLGDAEAVAELVERVGSTVDPGYRTVVDGFRLRTWWSLGRVDDVLRVVPASLAAARATEVAAIVHLALTNATIMYSYVGDVTEARRCLTDALAAAPQQPGPGHLVRNAVAAASLQLAEGDEKQATVTLHQALEASGLDQGVDRRVWRHTLPLTYVLAPETREHWDTRPLHGELLIARRLATAVVAVRAGNANEHLRGLDLPDLNAIRATLPVRLAAELAVGLDAAGRPEGRTLLDALGPPGRSAVRSAATTPSPAAKPARALLAAVPAPPPQPTYLGVLGPLTLRRGGPREPHLNDPGLRRTRVKALLVFLVGHRATTRAAIADALWPDLSEPQSSNNLAVTLSHALRLLEPWRTPGEPAYLVRLDRQNVRLITGEHLHIDIDDFQQHLLAAARAEDDAAPSVALGHYLAAVELYRGQLGAELPDAHWMKLDREHYRTRFVAAATRAGQLLLGQGDTDQAENVARRAIDIDPWAEQAHALLVSAALSTGNHSAAHRRLDRCLTMLTDLGAAPTEATRQLQRRLQTRPTHTTDLTSDS
jgi:DNA-binding SARP family transcriptional activator